MKEILLTQGKVAFKNPVLLCCSISDQIIHASLKLVFLPSHQLINIRDNGINTM
jgi:hypothetical protein